MNFESLWPILSVWGDKQYFFREILTAILTADDVLNQFLSFFIWFIQIIVFTITFAEIIAESLLNSVSLNWVRSKVDGPESGRPIQKWTILSQTSRSFEHMWTVQDDSGRFFESEWTVIRLKVDGPTNSTRQIPSTKMADIRSKNPLFMTIAVSYSRTKVNCLKTN